MCSTEVKGLGSVPQVHSPVERLVEHPPPVWCSPRCSARCYSLQVLGDVLDEVFIRAQRAAPPAR
jgi:hypothetical protein